MDRPVPRRLARQVALGLGAGLLGAGLMMANATYTSAQPAAPLWQRAHPTAGITSAPEVLTSIPVTIDVGRLRSSTNERFSLQLPDGRVVTVIKSREERVGNAWVWHGRLQNEPTSICNFALVNDSVVGSVLTAKGQAFRVRRDPGGMHLVEEIDVRKLPPEGPPTPIRSQRQGRPGDPSDTCSTDTAAQIDVMVVYTQAARAGAGGVAAMEATISLAIAQTNDAYGRSDIKQRLRLVHLAEVSYVESGDAIIDRDRLKDKADNFVDIVHGLRDTSGADIVVMITEIGGQWCGYTYQMEAIGNAFEDSAFAVVVRKCATEAGKYSFAHELGHVMGAAHDWNADGLTGSPFLYNHAHIQPAPTDFTVSPWRTIMALDGTCSAAGVSCPRILNFSNPDVAWKGDPTGVSFGPNPEDNHRVLNNTALTVANFRCSRIMEQPAAPSGTVIR